MYNHILWDFDGTLFDSYPVMSKTFVRCLLQEGHDEKLEKVYSLLKVSASHLKDYYREQYQLPDEFFDFYSMERTTTELKELQPFPHAIEVCKTIHSSNKSNYLYTHRGDSAPLFLTKYNMNTHFTELITSKNAFPRKPAPDAILYLLNKYKIQPETAIMVGDRDMDLMAAKNAGIATCFFNSEKQSPSIYADYTIHDLIELLDII